MSKHLTSKTTNRRAVRSWVLLKKLSNINLFIEQKDSREKSLTFDGIFSFSQLFCLQLNIDLYIFNCIAGASSVHNGAYIQT